MAEKLTPYEAISFELNLLRERRMAERRIRPRDSGERRRAAPGPAEGQAAKNGDAADQHQADSSNQTP